jgi:hypothetical protein
MIKVGDYGNVCIIAGKYKRMFGYYDDEAYDSKDEKAVVYLEGCSDWVEIPYKHLVKIPDEMVLKQSKIVKLLKANG